LSGSRGDEHNESARWSSDLKPAAAERRNQKAADDGCEQATLWRDAGRDGDSHRKR
jgi:hypothetical protein